MSVQATPLPITTSLSGKVVIVTGGGGVIGRALCLAFAQVDVADSTSTDSMVRQVRKALGAVDVLVNNAGFFRTAKRGSFREIPADEWDLAFHVNVRGVWNCTRSAMPAMRAQGGGHVINTGSNTLFRGVPFFLHYVSSKSALIGLTRSLARHLGKDNIAINLL